MPFLRQAFQKNAESYFHYKFANEKKEKQGVYFYKSKQDENILNLKNRLGYKVPQKINTVLFKKYYLKKNQNLFLKSYATKSMWCCGICDAKKLK